MGRKLGLDVEQRYEAVMALLRREEPAGAIARRHGICEATLYRLRDEFLAAGKESNWIQTVPGKGWFVFLRLYGAMEPWFDKTWRPGGGTKSHAWKLRTAIRHQEIWSPEETHDAETLELEEVQASNRTTEIRRRESSGRGHRPLPKSLLS